MAQKFEESLAQVRGKRQFIARCANELLELVDHDVQLFGQVSWDGLVSLPEWILQDRSRQQALRLVCGAVYWQPLIAITVQGSVLKQYQQLIGESMFEQLLSQSWPGGNGQVLEYVDQTDLSVSEFLNQAGASVLLALLEDEAVKALYQSVWIGTSIEIDKHQAQQVLNSAQILIESCSGHPDLQDIEASHSKPASAGRH